MELGDRLINRRRVKNDSSTHWSIRLQLVTSDDGDLCVDRGTSTYFIHLYIAFFFSFYKEHALLLFGFFCFVFVFVF